MISLFWSFVFAPFLCWLFGMFVQWITNFVILCSNYNFQFFFDSFINSFQIDDDEKVTMIDFPQMVSVSHRNAQMYELLPFYDASFFSMLV